jgi:hypothetical protein
MASIMVRSKWPAAPLVAGRLVAMNVLPSPVLVEVRVDEHRWWAAGLHPQRMGRFWLAAYWWRADRMGSAVSFIAVLLP